MHAGAPFVVLNTVVGSLAAYGLGGLQASFTAVLLNVLLVALHSLVATQFQIACVLATPNQDLVSSWHGSASLMMLCVLLLCKGGAQCMAAFTFAPRGPGPP